MTNNFIVVGTLIVTLGKTRALTIRTNNIQGQTPIFQQKIWYIVFLLSVAFGVSLSAVSMPLFTSVILPAIWKQKHGYVSYQLIRTTCGLLLLYASVGIMGTYIWCSFGLHLLPQIDLLCYSYTYWFSRGAIFCNLQPFFASPAVPNTSLLWGSSNENALENGY